MDHSQVALTSHAHRREQCLNPVQLGVSTADRLALASRNLRLPTPRPRIVRIPHVFAVAALMATTAIPSASAPLPTLVASTSISLAGICSAGEGYDILTSQCLPLYEATGVALTCGEGRIGSQLCPSSSQCCNREGFCGSGSECGATCVGGPCESNLGK